MKRTLTIFLAIVLVMSLMATTAFAVADGPVAVSTAVGKPGETVEVLVSLPGTYEADTIYLTFQVPEGLELKEAAWLVEGLIADVDLEANHAVWGADGSRYLHGDVFKLVLTIAEDAVPDKLLEIECELLLKQSTTELFREAAIGGVMVHETCTEFVDTVTAPSCTKGGYTTHTCVICGESYVDSETAPLGHRYGDWKTVEAATCTGKGSEKRTCVCGEVETRETDALGHRYGDWKTVEAATCTEAGSEQRTCVCGEVESRETGKLGHSFTNYVTDGNATCTADGTKTATCDRCEKTDTVTDEGSMIPHDYDFVITPPTCTKDGYTTHTCTGCGDSYVDSHTDALGHEFGDWKTVKAATCTGKGSEKRTCVCGKVETRETDALGHDFVDGICTVCGTADPDYAAPAEAGVIRIAGTSRSRTAYKAADELKEVLGIEKFDTIILASGDNFADALAGSYLAAVKKAPILLYRPNALNENADYITRNLADGGKVYILGGTASVSQEMEDTLTNSGIKVERLAGSNRYNTNLAILKEAGINGDEILVSTGLNFADSLSASATGLPILLVNSNSNKLTDAQITFLKEVKGAKLTIVGGTSSVSQELAEALSAYGTVGRVSGPSREKTSVAVAERYFPDADCAMVAYSRNYPDGLCGGPLAYILGAPLLLTDVGKEAPAQVFVETQGITRGIALGGPASVKDSSVRIVFAMAETDEIISK